MMLFMGLILIFRLGWGIENDNKPNVLANRATGDYMYAVLVGGFAFGLIYVTGLCYIHVRSRSRHRIQRLALCHLCLVLGKIVAVHGFIYNNNHKDSYVLFGPIMTFVSSVTLFLLVLNELFNAMRMYNYKRPLDPSLRAGNSKRDNFTTALQPSDIDDIYLLNPRTGKQFALTSLMLFSKLFNGYIYNNILMVYTILAQITMFEGNDWYVMHYCILAGLVLGILLSLSVPNSVLLPVSIFMAAAALLTGTIFMYNYFFETAAVFFWCYYFFAGLGYFIPDVGLLEVANIKTYEIYFALGLIIEQIPIMVTIYWVNSEYLTIYSLWLNMGLYLGFGMVFCVIFILCFPDDFQQPVLEIQLDILYYTEELDDDIEMDQY